MLNSKSKMIIIKWKTKPILTEQFRNPLKICRNRGTIDRKKKNKKNPKEYRSKGKIDCIFSLLGADTSIKSGEVILVVWIQTSLVGEMMSFQLLLGVFYVRVNANPHSVNIMQIM
jgi:hypothetical protein